MIALFFVGSFSYTSRAGFIFNWGVSLTHPMIALFFVGSFSYISHASFFLSSFFFFSFLNLWSFSYTSRTGFIFMRGVSLTHPVPALVFIWGVSLTHN